MKQRIDCGTPPISVTIRGVTYPSMGRAAAAFGAHVSSIWRAHKDGRLDRFGLLSGKTAADLSGDPPIRIGPTPRPAPRYCAVPDCTKQLRTDNTTGVCRRHNHHPQFSSTRNHARNRARNTQVNHG